MCTGLGCDSVAECLRSISKALESIPTVEKENVFVIEWVVMRPLSKELTLKLGPERYEGGSCGRVQGKNRAVRVKMQK